MRVKKKIRPRQGAEKKFHPCLWSKFFFEIFRKKILPREGDEKKNSAPVRGQKKKNSPLTQTSYSPPGNLMVRP